MTNESKAYTYSSNVDTSLDINDNKVEVHHIGQKQVKKGNRKGKSKVNEENKNEELEQIWNMLKQHREKKCKL